MPDGEIFSSGSRALTRLGSGAGGASRAYRADGGERAAALHLSAQYRTRGVHIVLAADEKRRPLMQLAGLDVEDSFGAIGCGSSSLLDDERQRIRLVQEPELSTLVFSVPRIGEEPAAEKVAMEIRDERAHVASAHRLPIAVLSPIVLHESLNRGLPLAVIRVVHRQISPDV